VSDPESLIAALYRDLAVQERRGSRVHKLAENIAGRSGVDAFNVQQSTALVLLDVAVSEEVASTSAFDDVPEGSGLQLALFILFDRADDVAVDWLKAITAADHTTHSQKTAAACCLAVYGAQCGNALPIDCAHWRDCIDTSSISFLKQLLAHVIAEGIGDEDLVVRILERLQLTKKRFIVRQVIRLFERVPMHKSDRVFELFAEAVVAPFREVLVGARRTHKDQKPDVFHDSLSAISQTPRLIERVTVNGDALSLGGLAGRLCGIGAHAMAAELGAHLVDSACRSDVMRCLMEARAFDDALHYGFDEKEVFGFVVQGYIE